MTNTTEETTAEMRKKGKRRCEHCNEEMHVVPGWNDEHWMVEYRGASATEMGTHYFCSEECIAGWADG